jgi:hypothetical protein
MAHEALAVADKRIDINVGGNAGRKFADLADKVLVARAAVDAFAASAAAAVKAFADMEAEQGRLQRQLKQTGLSAAEVAQTMSDLTREFQENASRLNVSVEEQSSAFRKLAIESKNAETAHKDFALAMDIAAGKGIDLAEATELVRKVRSGDLGDLKTYTSLTKDEGAALEKVSDEAVRVAKGMGVLSREYKGAAEETKGLSEQLGGAEQDLKLLQTAVGELIVVVGSSAAKNADTLYGAFADLFDLTDSHELTFHNFAVGMSNFAKEAKAAINELKYLGEAGDIKRDTEAYLQASIDRLKSGMGQEGGLLGEGTITPIPESAPIRKKKPPKKPPRRRSTEPVVDTSGSFLGGFGATDEDLKREKISIESAAEAERARAEAVAATVDAYNDLIDTQNRGVQIAKEMAAEDKRRADAEKKAIEEQRKAKEIATKESIAVADAAAQASADIAGAFIDDEAAKAHISAIIEGARSIADFATGNIPGGIGHAAAAVQFEVAAAMGGKGGGAAATGGGAASAKAGASLQNEAGRSVGESLGTTPKESGGLTVVINAHSVSKLTNEEARSLARSLRSELRTRA